MTGRSHYDVLGLEPDATADDIRRAWKTLIQVWHPDRFAGRLREEAEEMSKAVNEAYRILADPAARWAYDAGQGWRAHAEDVHGSTTAGPAYAADPRPPFQLASADLELVTLGIVIAVALLAWKVFHGAGDGYLLGLVAVGTAALVIQHRHPAPEDAPDELDLGDPRVWLYLSGAVSALALFFRIAE
jgi:hypothetical protein